LGAILVASCGTASAYKQGCRCTPCRGAQREAQRAYYERVGGNKNRKPWHKESANPWNDRRRQDAQRRRAQKLGTQTERIDNRSVYERDGWRCGICTESVNPLAAYPDPMSASLDHIQPLSLQGTHTYDNVRLAHLRCNIRRGNRVAA
jgi:hypothetical protein